MVTLAYSYPRFSSPEQRKDNSFDRQIRGRDAYVAAKGLTLDTSFIIEDAGVPAFRGVIAATGALSDFLKACEKKRIRPGSVLIVENLDRLSRDETLDAVMLFLGILNHGITLVTLFPEQEFSRENLDLARLVLAVAELARGHGESLAKSERSRSNWDKRRRNIASEILTGRKPSWSDIQEGKFDLDPTKAATVRRIFDYHVCIHRFDRFDDFLVYPTRVCSLRRQAANQETLSKLPSPLLLALPPARITISWHTTQTS